MRLLWLAPIPYSGDKEVHPAPWISTLARKLVDEKGCKITMLNYHPRLVKDEETIVKDGIEYVFLRTPVPKIDYLTIYSRRIRILRKYIKSRIDDFDLIHVHGSEHQYESSISNIPLPSLVSMQGIMTEYVKKLPNMFTYTFLSWFLASKFEKRNVRNIKNFICRTIFDTGFVKEYNPQANLFENWEMIREPFFENNFSIEKKNILFIGGSNPIKGIKEMLQALDLILDKINLKLLIVGKTDPSVIHSIIEEYQLDNIRAENIEVLGFQDQYGVCEAFRKSYCLVHPSYIDNSPNSVCEAQVSGLPVIASNVGGVSSLIDHDETGILVELSPLQIAFQIIRLLMHDELRDKISEQSRIVARERHNANTILEKTCAIYEKVMNAA
ncbi:MAG: glycosyltransferase family 4 protein [Bacteroidota bacterium]